MWLSKDVASEHAKRARVRSDQCRDASHERGLAGTVGPEHRKDRSLFRVELQSIECDRLPETLDHTGGFDHPRHSVPLVTHPRLTRHLYDGSRLEDVTDPTAGFMTDIPPEQRSGELPPGGMPTSRRCARSARESVRSRVWATRAASVRWSGPDLAHRRTGPRRPQQVPSFKLTKSLSRAS